MTNIAVRSSGFSGVAGDGSAPPAVVRPVVGIFGFALMAVGGFFLVRNVMTLAGRG